MFKVNPVAEELGLVDAHGPGAVLALASSIPPHGGADQMVLGSLGAVDGDTGDAAVRNASRPEVHFYGYLLDALEKLFENDLDQATFEENMRFLFGTKVRLSIKP